MFYTAAVAPLVAVYTYYPYMITRTGSKAESNVIAESYTLKEEKY
jgi:hypothetical protein